MQQNDAIKDLDGRVTFQKHNFFEPQPVDDAGVLFLRQCLHNYTDKDCIKILKAIVPALERNPSTKFLINDIILPESGDGSRFEEHYLRQIDVTMLVLLGSKERTEQEFKDLLKSADHRFEVRNVYYQFPARTSANTKFCLSGCQREQQPIWCRSSRGSPQSGIEFMSGDRKSVV